ncbi:MAG: glycosyltransferase family 4 protein, partial [Gammaproteobacteria bacterium]
QSIPWGNINLHWFGALSNRYLSVIESIPSIHLYGRVERQTFHDVLRKSDVLLFPSRAEGCPMTILEAMSFGLVCINSDGIGAMRWMTTSGHDGFVCSLKNWPGEMAQCLNYLLKDYSALQKMKQASRARFLREFQSQHTADKLLCLLDHPTVDRRQRQQYSTILKWHRPVGADGQTAPLLDRFYIRTGLLRKAGMLTVHD